MRPGIYVLLWLTITGCVDSFSFRDCANFTDVKHETVAERTVTLSFKIANTCTVTLRRVDVDYMNPKGYFGSTLCRFEFYNGTCGQSRAKLISCTCDDQGTFRVTAVMKDDQPEVWMLEGYTVRDDDDFQIHDVFRLEHKVWADKLTTTASTTMEIKITESASYTTTTKECPTCDSASCTSVQLKITAYNLVLHLVVGLLLFFLIMTCYLYRTDLRKNEQGGVDVL